MILQALSPIYNRRGIPYLKDDDDGLDGDGGDVDVVEPGRGGG